MRISDWSSDVCSSDLVELARDLAIEVEVGRHPGQGLADLAQRFQRHRRLAATRVEAARDVEARPRALQPVGLVDWKSVVWGQRGSVRVDRGGLRIIKITNDYQY